MVVMMQAIIFAQHHQWNRLFLILHHKSLQEPFHPLHTHRSRISLIEFWILYSTFSTRGLLMMMKTKMMVIGMFCGRWVQYLYQLWPTPRPSVQQPILLKLPFSCSLQKLFSPFKNYSAHLGEAAGSKARLCKALSLHRCSKLVFILNRNGI